MFEGFERQAFTQGDTIFAEGDTGDCAFLIESGQIAITIRQGNRSRPIGVLSDGDLFGEMALIDRAPRTATATAIEACHLVRIPSKVFDAELARSNPTVEHLLRLVLQRYRDLHHRLGTPGSAPQTQIASEQPDSAAAFANSRSNVIEYIQFATDIEDALRQEQFELYYQPIVTIDDERLAGFEALIRWQHPRHGIRAPAQFLAVAEGTDQILPIGLWTVERACRDLASLNDAASRRQQPHPRLFTSVNLSAPQLMHLDDTGRIAAILEEAGLDPSLIKIEVTETIMFDDPERATKILGQFEALGLPISLDDFGTGYSSLSHLQRFPVHDIKIDRSFVSHMLTDHNSMQIVKGAIELAHALDLNTTAEGVETAAELERLRELRCTFAQGYYYAKPLPLAEAIVFVEKFPRL